MNTKPVVCRSHRRHFLTRELLVSPVRRRRIHGVLARACCAAANLLIEQGGHRIPHTICISIITSILYDATYLLFVRLPMFIFLFIFRIQRTKPVDCAGVSVSRLFTDNRHTFANCFVASHKMGWAIITITSTLVEKEERYCHRLTLSPSPDVTFMFIFTWSLNWSERCMPRFRTKSICGSDSVYRSPNWP